MIDSVCARDECSSASILRSFAHAEDCGAQGVYIARLLGPDGNEKWSDTIENVVCTEGKNLAFNTIFAGSAYSVTGPYMGLISSVSFTAVAATDTAAQINGSNGWTEAGSGSNFPLYTTPRKTAVWSAASAGAIALSAALSFPIITTGGTVEGCFIIFGSGAVSTIANTSGTLWSAGVFTGGAKAVSPGDTLQVSYSSSM